MGKAYPEHLKQQAREMYIPYVFGSKQIGEILGVPATTVLRWINPEAARRDRQRSAKNKLKYRGTCIDCGGPTSYLSESMLKFATRCNACHRIFRSKNRKWNRESVIAAIQRWEKEHGRRPTPRDWIRKGEYYPGATQVYSGSDPIFDSWGDALRAAGFDDVQFSPGPGRKMFDRNEARRLRQHHTDAELARRYGVTPKAIYAALGPRAEKLPTRKKHVGTAAERRQARIDALNRALANTPSE